MLLTAASFALANSQQYTVIADTIDISDNSMILGDIFGTKFKLGADSKIYGNVDASNG